MNKKYWQQKSLVGFFGIFWLFLLSSPVVFARDFQFDIPYEVVLGDAFECRFSASVSHKIELEWVGKTLPLTLFFKEGRYRAKCLLPTGLKMKAGEKTLAFYVDGKKYTHRIEVTQKKFAEQWLKVNPSKVNLSQEDLERHYKEKVQVRNALDTMSLGCFWSLPFCRPVEGSVSSVFGLRRFFNKQPRLPHGGVDFRGKIGTPIQSCASGVVVLCSEHFFSGKSVYIDHGLGVVSMYFHLSEIDTKAGDFVSAGQIIGKIGATGRVTGPHLHFGLSVLGILVDPLPLVEGKEEQI